LVRQAGESDESGSSSTGTVRLLVVDSHPLVRWALTEIASQRGDITSVGDASTPGEAINLVYAASPDVVTIDCVGSDGDGWGLAATLRTKYPDLGIVILASEATDQMLFRALSLGASAFVSKSAPIPEVLAAIRHAGVSPSSFAAAGLADALRRRQHTTEKLALSPREQQILVLLHDGLSVPMIAAQLYVSLSTA
jgi:DNA-binding NarL/FixJ family response regulator